MNQPAYEERVVAVEEVSTTQGNKFGGGVEGDVEVAKGEGAEGDEGESIREGNTSTPPEE